MAESNTQSAQEKISIIVPFYNAAATLPRCVNSLRAQTWQNLEILLVDDGSTDGSSVLSDHYAAEDPRIRVLHVPHAGVAAARNAGLAAYTADYLMFADADDLTDPHYVEYLYRALQHGGTPLAYCNAFGCWGTPPVEYHCTGLTDSPEKDAQILKITDAANFLLHTSHRVVWGAIFTRGILNSLQFSEEYAVSTDTLFMAQALHRCREVTFLPANLYCYVLGHPSVSNRPFDRKRYDDLRVWDKVARLFSDLPGAPACSAAAHRDWKYRFFLKGLAREHSSDRELIRLVCRKIRFHYRTVFYGQKSRRAIVRELLFRTFPAAIYRFYLKNRQEHQ